MSQAGRKQYGLILPTSKKLGKKSGILASRPSVFGDDSSSDEGSSKHKEVNAEIRNVARKKIMQKQTQIEIQKAMEQDATVYEYDSIYDEIKEQGKVKIPQSVSSANKQKKPKYIGKLLKAAENRAKEKERIEERKIQKEREKEGDEFQDKPEFVTSAYKRKMQERQGEIEKEKRMDAIEEALDVRKQKDMSGFYRHFLNQQMGEETATAEVKKDADPGVTNEDEDTSMSFSSSDEENEQKRERKLKTTSEHNQRSQNHSKRYSTSGSDSTSEKEMSHSPSRRNPSENRSDSKSNGSREQDFKYSARDREHSNRLRGEEKYSKHDSKSHKKNYHTRHKRCRSHSRSPHHRSRHDRREDEKRHRFREETRGDEERKHKRNHHEESMEETKDDVQHLNQSHDNRLKIRERKNENKKDENLKNTDGKHEDSPAMEVYAKHSDKSVVLSARERYLARKAASSVQPVVEADSD